MEHLAIGGSAKMMIVNLVVAYGTLLTSFIIPQIAGMTIADWIIKILQIAALVFSIRASKNAMKNKNGVDSK